MKCIAHCFFQMLVCSYLVNFVSFFQDLSPYLGAVVPGLKQALLDPVPEVTSCNYWKFSLFISRAICLNFAIFVR